MTKKRSVLSRSSFEALSLVRHSSLVIRHFDLVPNCIHLRKIDVAQFFAARVQFVLQSIESRHKFVSRSLQRAFCIEFAFPCEIHDCKEQIAYLVFDRFLILL